MTNIVSVEEEQETSIADVEAEVVDAGWKDVKGRGRWRQASGSGTKHGRQRRGGVGVPIDLVRGLSVTGMGKAAEVHEHEWRTHEPQR